MSAIVNALQPALRPAIRSVYGGFGPPIIQRYFTTFDNTAQNYIELGSDVVLAGDFEIEVDVVMTTPSANATVVSGAQQSTDAVVIDVQTTGAVRAFAFNGGSIQSIIVSSAKVDDGKLNTIRLTYISGVARLYINGDIQGNANWTLVNPNVRYLGSRAAAINYLNGIVANVKTIDNGTTVLDMPIDEQLSGSQTAVLDKSPSANNGTFFNGSASSSELFTFDSVNNRWVGDEGTIIEVAS